MVDSAEQAGAGAVAVALAAFAALAAGLGLELLRLSLKPDGGGEAEFQAPNPVESLVVKWSDLKELDWLLKADSAAVGLVNRKKCTRCLQHERPWPLQEPESQV